MDKKEILDALKKAREAKKKNFTQKVDMVVNLKDLDLKKPEHQVDFFQVLQHNTGRTAKICALIGLEMEAEAKNNCDFYVLADDFDKYAKDKKLTKKLAEKYDFFIAQADLMGKVAAAFGRVLGPRNKMPNPKAGCVVPPKTPLKPVCERLKQTIRVSAKLQPMVQALVGNEGMNDEDITENILTVYNQLVHHLPGEENNVKSFFIKLTMGKAVRVK